MEPKEPLHVRYGFASATPEALALFDTQLKDKLEDLLLTLMLRADPTNQTTLDVEQLDSAVKNQHAMYFWQ
jgi:hypothetical protein